MVVREGEAAAGGGAQRSYSLPLCAARARPPIAAQAPAGSRRRLGMSQCGGLALRLDGKRASTKRSDLLIAKRVENRRASGMSLPGAKCLRLEFVVVGMYIEFCCWPVGSACWSQTITPIHS